MNIPIQAADLSKGERSLINAGVEASGTLLKTLWVSLVLLRHAPTTTMRRRQDSGSVGFTAWTPNFAWSINHPDTQTTTRDHVESISCAAIVSWRPYRTSGRELKINGRP